jgi:hypothetical protein
LAAVFEKFLASSFLNIPRHVFTPDLHLIYILMLAKTDCFRAVIFHTRLSLQAFSRRFREFYKTFSGQFRECFGGIEGPGFYLIGKKARHRTKHMTAYPRQVAYT